MKKDTKYTDLKKCVTELLGNITNEDREIFDPIADSLTDEQNKKLQSVIDKTYAIIFKKILPLFIMVMIAGKINAQAFAAFNAGTSHAGLSIGAESNNVAFTVAMAHSYYKTETPKYYSMQVGYVYSFADENSYVIGLHGGMAYTSRKVIKDNDVESHPKEFKGIYTLEAGKNMGTGRLSVTANYIGKIYYGVSIKCFL